MTFASRSLDEFLVALASPEPTPGGGTASAIAGAMGVSLLVMVAGLTKTRANTADERATLLAVRASLEPLRLSLQECADRDAEAFGEVMAAFRMPRASDDEKARRTEAVQSALRAATDVPLETLRLATRALELGETVGRLGNPAAASDVGVAAGLLRAAADGAAANVRINLDGLTNQTHRAGAKVEGEQLLDRSEVARARILAALG
ncbi:MAG: cyclodeaminase/cyclohydrolase family protein [Acidobacteriota bacterium]|nr:cyclodeaminase/cyclohydrolase family protein [Acidobacteriota bacterium]